jgi:hypothetical protein
VKVEKFGVKIEKLKSEDRETWVKDKIDVVKLEINRIEVK